MAEDLPHPALHLWQSINIQLENITIGSSADDYNVALRQQREELLQWKHQILADPASVQPSSAKKRPAVDEEAREENEEAVETAPSTKRRKRSQTTECSTCFDTFPVTETVRLRCCFTRYCRECFREWFTAALDSKQLPKCCDIGIEPKDYARYLNADVKKQYKAVTTELDAERRLWCSNQDCRAFIKIEEDASGFIPCSRCRRKTCASCTMGVTAHKGRNKACANYVSDDRLNDAIEANKWKRCPRCHVPVEKTTGCQNIRCRCGVLFCFACGISKNSESARCKCSHSGMIVNELVEDPTHEDWQAPPVRRPAPLIQRHGLHMRFEARRQGS